MKIYLKNIDINKIIPYSNYSKDITIKAYNRLKNLNVCDKTFSVYQGNERVEWFSNSNDSIGELKNYNESDNKEEFLIKWYFRRYINNECNKIIKGYC